MRWAHSRSTGTNSDVLHSYQRRICAKEKVIAELERKLAAQTATSEEVAQLTQCYAEAVESSDQRHDKTETAQCLSKLQKLLATYRLVPQRPRRRGHRPQKSIVQFQRRIAEQPRKCHERLKAWEQLLLQDFQKQEAELNRRLGSRGQGISPRPESTFPEVENLNTDSTELPAKDDRELSKAFLESSQDISKEGLSDIDATIAALQESLNRIHENKADKVASALAKATTEMLERYAAINAKYDKEMAMCQATQEGQKGKALYKAVLSKLGDKKGEELRQNAFAFDRLKADIISEIENECTIRSNELYEELQRALSTKLRLARAAAGSKRGLKSDFLLYPPVQSFIPVLRHFGSTPLHALPVSSPEVRKDTQ